VTVTPFDLAGDQRSRGRWSEHIAERQNRISPGARSASRMQHRRLLGHNRRGDVVCRHNAHWASICASLTRISTPERFRTGARGAREGGSPDETSRRPAPPDDLPPWGLMIRVPGAGARRRRVAAEADFSRNRHQRPDPIHLGDSTAAEETGRHISTIRCTRRLFAASSSYHRGPHRAAA